MDEDKARADFERALASPDSRFGSFFLSRLLGLEISYGEESCTVAFTVADWMFNPQGSLHGGIIATVLDISMGHLLKHVAGPGVTLEMKTQYMRAIRAGRATAEARVLRRGRSVAFLETRLLDADGKLAAAATSTWQMVSPPTNE